VPHPPVPVALDEELIGISDPGEKKKLLETIRPHYIILKPSLHGGISGCSEWITLAESLHIGWWITSALDVEHRAEQHRAMVRYPRSNPLPQGLGTGTPLHQQSSPSRWRSGVIGCGFFPGVFSLR